MAKMNELPPVPEDPVRPPEVKLRDEEPLLIVADDGVKIDGRVVVPSGASRVVVIAHPHPLYGGTMNNAVVVALSKVVSERGAAVVRFDFRGVGKSEGAFGAGKDEVCDVVGAVRAAMEVLPGAPVTLVGYSFGSGVSWHAVRRRAIDVERFAMVAPAARLFDFGKAPQSDFDRPLAIVLGDHDDFCDVSEAQTIAAQLGASLCVVRGADHYFMTGRRRLAELVAPFVLGESDTLPAVAEAKGAEAKGAEAKRT